MRPGGLGSGVVFRAGAGVGTVTRPGLPVAVGEPAIDPLSRRMMAETVEAARGLVGGPADLEIVVAIDNGEKLALRTPNNRFGIVGGLSVTATGGLVEPIDGSSWTASIQFGVDIARAMGFTLVAGSTDGSSEQAVRALHDLDEVQLIDMGDHVGGFLGYLCQHRVERVTLALDFAKAVELAQGLLDLAAKHGGAVDFDFLAAAVAALGGTPALAETVRAATGALEALDLCLAADLPLADRIAAMAWKTAAKVISGSVVSLEVVIFGRAGGLLATTGFRPA